MCITRVWSLVRGGWKLGSFLLEIFPLAGGGNVVERDTTRDSCHVPEASILHVRMVWGTGAKMLGGFPSISSPATSTAHSSAGTTPEIVPRQS